MSINNNDVVVAVMGVTGCGKSSFIKKVTGRSDVKVGDSLTSETAVVQEYKFSHNGINYVLVDTPGFDDTYTDNETIARRVIEWLSNSYRGGVRLNGLVYLHRITDQRMSGSSFENLRMFRELCGDQGLTNVVLTSTFWDTVSRDNGERRQRELETSMHFWSRMISKGCRTARLDGQRSSCLRVLEDISRNNGKVVMQIQQEVVDEGKAIRDTAAARETFLRLQREMQEKAEREAEALRQEEQRRLQAIEDSNRRERQRVAAELERQRKAEAERRRREEQEYREEQERIRKEEEAERARETAEQQRIIREREERLRQLQREKREQEARQQRADYEARQAYYRRYSCQRGRMSRGYCSRCYTRIKRCSYYHCCHCNYDNYDHCLSCGASCPVTEHPIMPRYYTIDDDDCVIM